ncbi:uncharacterized protein LOC119733737, partial [Patiria miniata]|uniref:SET domain-containing protein n=1 Tax=Patiria miniata TaxID=46514 RepID=A0A914AH73_PATMI
HFDAGEFLMEYDGKLISAAEGERREETTDSFFRYFFTSRGTCTLIFFFFDCIHCGIDATSEPTEGKQLGRLVNHGDLKEANSKMKVIMDGDKPTLCLFSIKPIQKAKEVLYDYGINKPEMVSQHLKMHRL